MDAPVHRAEERLYARGLPQWPPPPLGSDEQEFVAFLAEEVRQAAVEVEQLSGGNFDFQDFELTAPEASAAPWLIAATDGSHRDGVGAYSVALPGGRGGGSGDGAEDQGAFRNELKALQVLFQAVSLATQRGLPPRVLWVVVDCQAALLSLRNPEASCLPLLASSAAAKSKDLQLRVPRRRVKTCRGPAGRFGLSGVRRTGSALTGARRRLCLRRFVDCSTTQPMSMRDVPWSSAVLTLLGSGGSPWRLRLVSGRSGPFWHLQGRESFLVKR